MAIVSLLHRSQLSLSVGAKRNLCFMVLRGLGEDGLGCRAVQKLGFASSSQLLSLPLWPDNNNKDEIQKIYVNLSLLKCWKRLHLHLIGPTPRKITVSTVVLPSTTGYT